MNPRNKGLIQIELVDIPEGPIRIKRCNPSKGESFKNKLPESISTQMIWRLANALRPNQPINVDRIFCASYNTRSVLEALLAHTPQFYYCYPGRIEIINSSESIKQGHKHLMWVPDNPHKLGVIEKIQTDIVISEIPLLEAYYDALVLPKDLDIGTIDIEIKTPRSNTNSTLFYR